MRVTQKIFLKKNIFKYAPWMLLEWNYYYGKFIDWVFPSPLIAQDANLCKKNMLTKKNWFIGSIINRSIVRLKRQLTLLQHSSCTLLPYILHYVGTNIHGTSNLQALQSYKHWQLCGIKYEQGICWVIYILLKGCTWNAIYYTPKDKMTFRSSGTTYKCVYVQYTTTNPSFSLHSTQFSQMFELSYKTITVRRGTNALHDADCKVSQTKLNNISICRYLCRMRITGWDGVLIVVEGGDGRARARVACVDIFIWWWRRIHVLRLFCDCMYVFR